MQLNIKILATIIFSFLTLNTISQSYKFLYHLDKDLGSTSQEKAIIIGKGYESDGKLILDCFLKNTGKKILSATVKDSSLSTLHGMFKTYYDDMNIESAGMYFENDMEGVWKYWDKDGFLTDSVIYKNSVRIAYANFEYYFSKPTLEQFFFRDSLKNATYSYLYSFTDSLKNTFEEKQVSVINGKQKTDFEVNFIGDRGLFKEYDSTGAVKSDSVFTKKMQEAQFADGEDEWRNFLRKTLNANVPANNNAPSGKYTIIMTFIVNPNGTLSNIKAESDPGYGMVEEAKRVLKMHKWKPAIQYGNYRIAYRRQPITFLVEN
jgi:antitoxin component YwqK of YwqJK toxin-antitoxin module